MASDEAIITTLQALLATLSSQFELRINDNDMHIPTPFVLSTLLLLVNSVSAWYGSVTFYQDVEFKGSKYEWGISKTHRCYNLSCWDNRASSVKWDDLPTVGSFDGKARIAFFTGKDCTGDSRDWPTNGVINGKKGNYPMDFTLDGINDVVSSFIVWEYGKKISNGIATPCPWGTS